MKLHNFLCCYLFENIVRLCYGFDEILLFVIPMLAVLFYKFRRKKYMNRLKFTKI